LNKRILIVETNKTCLKLMTDILELTGYETLHADDGFEAISLALANLPDLTLLDIRMSYRLEVIRGVRDNESSRRIPIVGVTADPLFE
jgi:two-component system, cell cycle response regulator